MLACIVTYQPCLQCINDNGDILVPNKSSSVSLTIVAMVLAVASLMMLAAIVLLYVHDYR